MNSNANDNLEGATIARNPRHARENGNPATPGVLEKANGWRLVFDMIEHPYHYTLEELGNRTLTAEGDRVRGINNIANKHHLTKEGD